MAEKVREFNGKPHILESALTADFAFVKAWKGDIAGNLIFKGTARNFNPMMAMAGKITVAEVEELVLQESLIQHRFIRQEFLYSVFSKKDYEKRIEQENR